MKRVEMPFDAHDHSAVTNWRASVDVSKAIPNFNDGYALFFAVDTLYWDVVHNSVDSIPLNESDNPLGARRIEVVISQMIRDGVDPNGANGAALKLAAHRVAPLLVKALIKNGAAVAPIEPDLRKLIAAGKQRAEQHPNPPALLAPLSEIEMLVDSAALHARLTGEISSGRSLNRSAGRSPVQMDWFGALLATEGSLQKSLTSIYQTATAIVRPEICEGGCTFEMYVPEVQYETRYSAEEGEDWILSYRDNMPRPASQDDDAETPFDRWVIRATPGGAKRIGGPQGDGRGGPRVIVGGETLPLDEARIITGEVRGSVALNMTVHWVPDDQALAARVEQQRQQQEQARIADARMKAVFRALTAVTLNDLINLNERATVSIHSIERTLLPHLLGALHNAVANPLDNQRATADKRLTLEIDTKRLLSDTLSTLYAKDERNTGERANDAPTTSRRKRPSL